MILILPDNMDDFTYDAEEESPPPKAEGAPEEVDKSDPSHQSIKIASSAMSVHSNMGEGQAAPHPSKFGLKGSVSAKTANKQKRGKWETQIPNRKFPATAPVVPLSLIGKLIATFRLLDSIASQFTLQINTSHAYAQWIQFPLSGVELIQIWIQKRKHAFPN